MVCDICGSSTVLDPSSATELLTQQSNTEPPASKPKRSAKEPSEYVPISGKSKIYSQNQPAAQSQAQPQNYYSEDIYCKSHPDEEVRYFCFDCLTPPVCSECVVHGIHKGHDVLHIKKAFPSVKEKLDGVIQ